MGGVMRAKNMTITELYKRKDDYLHGEEPLSTSDLKILRDKLEEVVEFMKFRGERSIVVCLYMEIESIENMIDARVY